MISTPGVFQVREVPVPQRVVPHPSRAIHSVTYIQNMALQGEYYKMREEFKKTKKNTNETLLFHGTAVSNIEGIINNGFNLESVPQQRTTDNQWRKKGSVFGRGIYLTTLPGMALMYGNGLLLCKVLLGNSETFVPTGHGEVPQLAAESDSRLVTSRQGDQILQVVRNPAQVCSYVLAFKCLSVFPIYKKVTFEVICNLPHP